MEVTSDNFKVIKYEAGWFNSEGYTIQKSGSSQFIELNRDDIAELMTLFIKVISS